MGKEHNRTELPYRRAIAVTDGGRRGIMTFYVL
jgi:hypothetical protein